VPHASTGEKPSFLLFGWDLRSPTEAAFTQSMEPIPSTMEDYSEHVLLSLSLAGELALGRHKANTNNSSTVPQNK